MKNRNFNALPAGISSGVPSPREFMQRKTASGLLSVAEAAALDVDEVMEVLGTTREGLTEGEAEGRLDRYGFNEVAHEKPPRW
jgi:hypothetical protein